MPRYDAVRPGLITYGLVPDELLPDAPVRPSRATHLPHRFVAGAERLRPALSLHARPVRVADLPVGHGVSYGPTCGPTGRAGSPPSRSATATAGRDRSRTGPIALVRGVRVPLVGNVAMDAAMADVTDVPGPPVDVDDEFVLIGRQGDEPITAAERGAMAHHQLLGGDDRDVRPPDPGVPCAGWACRNRVPFPRWRTTWPASNSGTATSATSRSTRS